MAWTFDTATGTAGYTENNTDGTMSFTSNTVGSLTNGIGFVTVAWATTSSTISGITWNGVAMTEAIAQGSGRATAIWYILNPAAGATTITITWGAAAGRAVAGSQTWSGANASQSPQTKTGTGTSATPTLSACPSASGELLIDCLGISFTAGDTLTAGGSQTERCKFEGGATRMASSSLVASAATHDMSWTDSTSRNYGYCAASFDAAAASTVGPLLGGRLVKSGILQGRLVR